MLGERVEYPETVATAIRIGNPASWERAERARDESGGLIDVVTDEEILSAYLRLSRDEGLFCEPASAASLAGFLRLPELGVDVKGKTVVCILTGNGLKDPGTAESRALVEIEYVAPDLKEIASMLSTGPGQLPKG